MDGTSAERVQWYPNSVAGMEAALLPMPPLSKRDLEALDDFGAGSGGTKREVGCLDWN